MSGNPIRYMGKETLRTFDSLREYFSLFRVTFARMRDLRKISQEEKITPQFREKLMVASSAVNQCAYCSYLHSRTALEQGISQEEIDTIFKNDVSQFSEEDLPGILFAQHFAETKGKVSEDALQNIEEKYGTILTRQMQAFLQTVLFGNLCCNIYVSFKKNLLTKERKNRLRLVYFLSIPVARMIYKKSGMHGDSI